MDIYEARRILGLQPGASAQEAKRAWRALLQQTHPDHNPEDPLAGERVLQINQAYQVFLESPATTDEPTPPRPPSYSYYPPPPPATARTVPDPAPASIPFRYNLRSVLYILGTGAGMIPAILVWYLVGPKPVTPDWTLALFLVFIVYEGAGLVFFLHKMRVARIAAGAFVGMLVWFAATLLVVILLDDIFFALFAGHLLACWTALRGNYIKVQQ